MAARQSLFVKVSRTIFTEFFSCFFSPHSLSQDCTRTSMRKRRQTRSSSRRTANPRWTRSTITSKVSVTTKFLLKRKQMFRRRWEHASRYFHRKHPPKTSSRDNPQRSRTVNKTCSRQPLTFLAMKISCMNEKIKEHNSNQRRRELT